MKKKFLNYRKNESLNLNDEILDDDNCKLSQKDKNMIYKFLSTLLYSWGGDAPSEVIWAGNEFIDFLNYKYKFNIAYLQEIDIDDNNSNIIEQIKNL